MFIPCHWCSLYDIYTTKIDEFVCPPSISETVAVWIMTLAHRPRIASTTIKLISKPMLLSIFSILLKIINRIGAGPKRKLSPPYCLFTVIRQIPLISVSWIIWCCHLADQFVLHYVRYCLHPHTNPCWHGTLLVVTIIAVSHSKS